MKERFLLQFLYYLFSATIKNIGVALISNLLFSPQIKSETSVSQQIDFAPKSNRVLKSHCGRFHFAHWHISSVIFRFL